MGLSDLHSCKIPSINLVFYNVVVVAVSCRKLIAMKMIPAIDMQMTCRKEDLPCRKDDLKHILWLYKILTSVAITSELI